jgi:hypothetical protein
MIFYDIGLLATLACAMRPPAATNRPRARMVWWRALRMALALLWPGPGPGGLTYCDPGPALALALAWPGPVPEPQP